MKFEEVLPAMRAGKRVQLHNGVFHLRDGEIYSEGIGPVFRLSDKIVLADDWEILPDPEPEPQWLLLEPGMTIKEGDEFEYQPKDWHYVHPNAYGIVYMEHHPNHRRRIDK